MNQTVIRYHYVIRMLGLFTIMVFIGYTDYREHITLLMALVLFYGIYITIARLQIGIFKDLKYHIFNLFFDVTMLSVAIAMRGGLRSDFYLGYFLILGYVLLIRNKHLLIELSGWIVLNYLFFTYFFSESEHFDYSRLIIRLTLLIGTSLLLERYSKMLLESETLREKAVSMAMYDALTGAYNRRIMDYLGDLYTKNTLLYIVLIDIDNFKLVNDTYGHQKGDEVLVALTEEILKVIDEQSICIRYGGEEFLLIIEAKEYAFVQKKIQKIQHNFQHRAYAWLEKHKTISFTAGISVKKGDEPIQKSIEEADQALYSGKNKGKNCIVINDQRPAV